MDDPDRHDPSELVPSRVRDLQHVPLRALTKDHATPAESVVPVAAFASVL